jgi:hypothetical protein
MIRLGESGGGRKGGKEKWREGKKEGGRKGGGEKEREGERETTGEARTDPEARENLSRNHLSFQNRVLGFRH